MPSSRLVSPLFAYSSLIVLYLAGWGEGIYKAVLYLVGGLDQTSLTATSSISTTIRLAAVAVALIMAGMLLTKSVTGTTSGLGISLPRGTKEWTNEVRLGLITIASILTAITLGMMLFGDTQYPGIRSDGWSRFLPNMVSMALAGPSEEILLVAVPVVVLRSAGQSWSRVFLFCITLRMLFHVYYGLNTLTLLVWAVTVLILFTRHHRILGIVVAHSTFDCFNFLAVNLHLNSVVIVIWYVGLLALLIIVMFYWDRYYGVVGLANVEQRINVHAGSRLGPESRKSTKK